MTPMAQIHLNVRNLFLECIDDDGPAHIARC